MKIFGLAGWSGSGKTTLVSKLIPALIARGTTVSTVKHAHHAFDVDKPGKDSYVHRQAGATEVLVTSQNRWALMHENRGVPEASLGELLPRLSPVDLELIEGFKAECHPKLEVFRPKVGKSLRYPSDQNIVAVASDAALPDCPLPVLSLNNVDEIADFIIAYLGLQQAQEPGFSVRRAV